MKVLVEVGPDLHLFEAVAVSLEGQEVSITLPTLEIATVEVSKDMADYVRLQIEQENDKIILKADKITFTHVLVATTREV